MKIELELSVLEYDLLLELVYKKYLKLDNNRTKLLSCRDFSTEDNIVEFCEKELQALQSTLVAFQNLHEKLVTFEAVAASELAVLSASEL